MMTVRPERPTAASRPVGAVASAQTVGAGGAAAVEGTVANLRMTEK